MVTSVEPIERLDGPVSPKQLERRSGGGGDMCHALQSILLFYLFTYLVVFFCFSFLSFLSDCFFPRFKSFAGLEESVVFDGFESFRGVDGVPKMEKH